MHPSFLAELPAHPVHQSIASPNGSVNVAHINVGIFVLTLMICNAIGVVMGPLTSGTVLPVALANAWKRERKVGAISGSFNGLAADLTA